MSENIEGKFARGPIRCERDGKCGLGLGFGGEYGVTRELIFVRHL